MLGKEVVRPDIAGLMGAYGCSAALPKQIGSDGHVSDISDRWNECDAFTMRETQSPRCGGCENHCMLTITRFNDGRTLCNRKPL